MSFTLDETFKTFHRVLSFAGISIYANQNWKSKLWLSWQIFNFIIGVLCFIFTTGFVVTYSNDLNLCIDGACIWTTGVIMTITLGVCLIFRNDFREYLNEMAFKEPMLEMPFIEYLIRVPPNTNKLRELRQLVCQSQENILKYTRLFIKIYLASVYLCVILYLCKPMYQMITSEDKTERILGFEMWFPWSLENFKVYIVSLIFNIYSAHLCSIGTYVSIPCDTNAAELFPVLAYPGLQSTIILLLSQVIRQLKILSFVLQHLNELVLEMTDEQNDKWKAYCKIIFIHCVDHYIKVRRFSHRLNNICMPFYLTLILVATMLVCVCSVKIATASDKLSLDTMKYYVHEFCFIVVVLSFCILGQQVENQCDILENVVTEKWYIYGTRHCTNVRIFHMALSQKMPIYIFGTITLSLPTFTWFLKTGMSFFTLVMSVLEDDVN